jgi:hypothetical protein
LPPRGHTPWPAVPLAPAGRFRDLREYLESLAHEMGAVSWVSGEQTVNFQVMGGRGSTRISMRLSVKGRGVELEATSGPDKGKKAVIADCLHVVSGTK